MRIGPVWLWCRMYDGSDAVSKSRLVIAWQTKNWWTWAIWWWPALSFRPWRIEGANRGFALQLGRFGEFRFEYQK